MTGDYTAEAMLARAGKRALRAERRWLDGFLHFIAYGLPNAQKGRTLLVPGPPNQAGKADFPATRPPYHFENALLEAFLDWSVMMHSYGAQLELKLTDVTGPVQQNPHTLRRILRGQDLGMAETRLRPTFVMLGRRLYADWSVEQLIDDLWHRRYWHPPGVRHPDFHISDAYFRMRRPAPSSRFDQGTASAEAS